MKPDSVASDPAASLQYHHREWVTQRIGWAAMALVLLAALAGVFGDGPVSETQTRTASGDSITYDRFARHGAPTLLAVYAAGHNRSDNTLELRIADSYLEAFRIETITPEPKSSKAASGEIVFTFDVDSTPANIAFHLEPDRIGKHSGHLRIGAGEPLRISQFTYP